MRKMKKRVQRPRTAGPVVVNGVAYENEATVICFAPEYGKAFYRPLPRPDWVAAATKKSRRERANKA
jgi:hypothetical protein